MLKKSHFSGVLVQLQGDTKMAGGARLARRPPGLRILTGSPFCWLASSKDRGQHS